MPEPWPDQEALIHLRGKNINRPPQKKKKTCRVNKCNFASVIAVDR